jgi:uncharacterized protein
MTDRSNVEIDYCPKCRGVWLDRGELDKIIERSDAKPAPMQTSQSAPPPAPHHQVQQPYQPERGSYSLPHRRKESFLSDLFDF